MLTFKLVQTDKYSTINLLQPKNLRFGITTIYAKYDMVCSVNTNAF